MFHVRWHWMFEWRLRKKYSVKWMVPNLVCCFRMYRQNFQGCPNLQFQELATGMVLSSWMCQGDSSISIFIVRYMKKNTLIQDMGRNPGAALSNGINYLGDTDSSMRINWDVISWEISSEDNSNIGIIMPSQSFQSCTFSHLYFLSAKVCQYFNKLTVPWCLLPIQLEHKHLLWFGDTSVPWKFLSNHHLNIVNFSNTTSSYSLPVVKIELTQHQPQPLDVGSMI